MAKILFFVFSVIGMTNIIVDSTLFLPIRNTLQRCKKCHEMITCHQCCGFWCGLICSWAIISHDFLWVFLGGCAGSFLASTYTLFSDWVISKTDFVLGEEEVNDE